MKGFKNWKTWAVIIGLLLFSGIASVGWLLLSSGGDANATAEVDLDEPEQGNVVPNLSLPFFGDEPAGSGDDTVVIRLDQYLFGDALVELPGFSQLNGMEVDSRLLLLILTAVVVGSMLAFAVPLGLIYMKLDQQTVSLKEDPEFQAKQAEIERRERERLKELEKAQPPTPMPDHERRRWATVSTALVTLTLVFFVGLALSETFFPGGVVTMADGRVLHPTLPFATVLMLLALLTMVWVYRPRSADSGEGAESADNRPIPWATLFVILSGLIFLGIGTGLMLAIRSTGG